MLRPIDHVTDISQILLAQYILRLQRPIGLHSCTVLRIRLPLCLRGLIVFHVFELVGFIIIWRMAIAISHCSQCLLMPANIAAILLAQCESIA